jgi:oligopeptide/dipeptide ABC transporter ATP-binding protein
MSKNHLGRAESEPTLLEVADLVQAFPGRRERVFQFRPDPVLAVRGVNFNIRAGDTLGLVGESGCGKSTVALSILRLLEPTSGRVVFDGVDVGSLGARELRRLRKRVQMVLQDPLSSLSPRRTARASVREPLDIHSVGTLQEREERVDELLERVGLDRALADKYPSQLSGGQNQRVSIARALTLSPDLLILDEAVAALDVSVQAQIINLLNELQDELNLAFLFISHDLAVVKQMCDRVAVMYLGKIVEENSADRLFADPKHPYTKALLSAIPIPDPAVEACREQIVLSGDVPSPTDAPAGCAFRTRCPVGRDEEICATSSPDLIESGRGLVACHFVESHEVQVGTK